MKSLSSFFLRIKPYLSYCLLVSVGIIVSLSLYLFLSKQIVSLQKEKGELSIQLAESNKKYTGLVTQDQYKRNEALQKQIKQLEDTYAKSSLTYEQLVELKLLTKTDTQKLDKDYATLIKLLSQKNYASASSSLVLLSSTIKTETAKAASSFAGTSSQLANVPSSNSPPGSGYSRQKVTTSVGDFIVSIVSADLNSTRVIVDTASDGDCKDNCPVLSLGDYVSRSGAFAGINGTYFCPADYPSCVGKANSFDLLVMNKNKKYINSDNNVYSTNPAVIFQNGSIRFVGRALEWGRDTGVDGVLSNYPLLLSGGTIQFGGDGDPKKGSKGPRGFVGAKGSTVYIGIVQNATVAEGAYVLKALGLTEAMNLDSGGSTALWSGGYKAGPGRAIPNAILFVRK